MNQVPPLRSSLPPQIGRQPTICVPYPNLGARIIGVHSVGVGSGGNWPRDYRPDAFQPREREQLPLTSAATLQ